LPETQDNPINLKMHPILISGTQIRGALTVLMMLALSSCARGPIASVEDRSVDAASTDSGQTMPSNDDANGETSTPFIDRTYQVEQAERYSQLAKNLNEPGNSINATLSAAEYYIQADDAERAMQTIAQLQFATLNDAQRARYEIIVAYGDYSRSQYQGALDRLYALLGVLGTQETNQQRVDALLLSSLCHQALNEYDLAVTNLIERESLLVGAARADTSRYIWKVIGDLSTEQRQTVINGSSNAVVRNRFEQSLLGLVGSDLTTDNRNALSSSASRQMQFDQWRDQADRNALIADQSQWTARSAKNIAILLPLTSRYNKAAQALLDGIEYQHSLNASNYQPNISVYDIGENPFQVSQYYAAARQAGADLIIGPLGKEQANELVTSSRGFSTIPTILLGGDQTLSQNMARLTMSPEHQGRIVSERAFSRGFVNAALLVSSDSTGTRTAQAFSKHWLENGGKMSKTITYSPLQFDHSTELKQLFEINKSEFRMSTLSRTLGFKPEFAAYRRHDIDFIFMISDNETGRILRPQITFFSGERVPVLSSSPIYNGIQDPINNVDLDRTSFPVMPWVLLSNDVAPYAGQLNMLYAMGSDAYRVAAEFNEMRNQSNKVIAGNMGVLSVETSGEVQFQPIWANFKDGTAESENELVPLEHAPEDWMNSGGQPNGQHGTKSYDESNWDRRQSRRKPGS
jgi:outer membrane PBP1 activator LpoA protein